MSFLIGLLTVVLALNCVVLILLVLIQLPKKEAGAGLAFGGGATDALFGAGSGNVLTKITKWSAGIFFGLAIVISFLNTQVRKQEGTIILPTAQQQAARAAATTPTPAPAAVPAAPAATDTNTLLSFPAPADATNTPVAK